MQEIRDNTSVDPCSDLPDELMQSYLAVPTYLMEPLWNFSPCLGWLKGGTFRPCLPYLAFFEINRTEYGNNDIMVPQT
jgi:hypothetical protein